MRSNNADWVRSCICARSKPPGRCCRKPVASLRSSLSELPPTPVLVRALIEEQNALKVRLLILNDDMGDELTPGVIHLSRPYGERELSSAIDQLVG